MTQDFHCIPASLPCLGATPPNGDVYVLGSGASLLELTTCEREHLRGQITVAMNKYVLFWDKIGVFPTHYFLGDMHNPAPLVFQCTRDIARSVGQPLHYLLDESFRPLVQRKGGGEAVKAPCIVGGSARADVLCVEPPPALESYTFFRRPHVWEAPLHWASSLDEELFFYRGSLSVLLNLLAVLRLGRRIKLLGVDLSNGQSFFDDELRGRPELHDQFVRRTMNDPEAGHATAVVIEGMPGIQSRWPFIMHNLEAAGFECVCCNRRSLLVEQRLCEWAPVIEH